MGNWEEKFRGPNGEIHQISTHFQNWWNPVKLKIIKGYPKRGVSDKNDKSWGHNKRP